MINGNGVSTATGRQLLQIIPINIVTILTMVVCAVGLYWKFDSRIATQEKRNDEMFERLKLLEAKANENSMKITRIDVNILWMMEEFRREKK